MNLVVNISAIVCGLAALIAIWEFILKRLKSQMPGAGSQQGVYISRGKAIFLMLVVAVCVATSVATTVRTLTTKAFFPRTLEYGEDKNGCTARVNTSDVQQSKRSGYYLYLACGIVNPSIDLVNDTQIVISAPFTINGDYVEILAPWTPAILARHPTEPPISVWHTEFLLPKNVDVSRITRLADVEVHGGMFLKDEVM